MIFSSGSRYSQQLKGGAILIAKLAHVPIVPVVYQGPLRFSQILCRQKITVRFGQPIMIPTGHLKIEETQFINDQIHDALNQLDHEIDPKFQYIPDQKRYMEEQKHGDL